MSAMKTQPAHVMDPVAAAPAVATLVNPADVPALSGAAAPAVEPLDDFERGRLAELEGIIRRGKETFIEVGLALAEVREARLYREKYRTFQEYCAEEWELSARQAQQIRNAAEVVRMLELDRDANNCSYFLPANEAQARPLTSLPTRELKVAAWREAIRTAPGGKLTGKHVEAVVRSFLGTPAAASVPAADPGAGASASAMPNRAADKLKGAEAAITYTRQLKDAIGTPDSAAAVGVLQALALLQEYRNHLEKQEELHAARAK